MASATTATTSGKTALILGPTGAVGSKVLAALLESPHYSKIHAFVRSGSSSQASTDPKVQQHTIDFEKLCESPPSEEEVSKLKGIGADDVYILLGTTRGNAGSASAFERIDREYVLAAGKAAQREGGGEKQGLVYCSAQAANSSAPFLYPKSKGLTEEGLSSLPSYSPCLIYRPGFLYNAQRPKSRPLETFYGFLTHNILAKVSDSAEIDTTILARAMVRGLSEERGKVGVKDGKLKGDGTRVVSNAEALKLGKA